MRRLFRQLYADVLWYEQVQATTPLVRPFLLLCLFVPLGSLFGLMIHRFGFWVNHRFGKIHEGSYLRAVLKFYYWLGRYLLVVFRKIEIEENSEFGSKIWLSNKGNLLLGAKKIGKQCIINHNVTIGYGFGAGQKMNRPELGDRIWIGPNTVIHGGIIIGSGVLIMANSVVGKNIPDNCIVGGNPARIIARNVNITDRVLFKEYAEQDYPFFPNGK